MVQTRQAEWLRDMLALVLAKPPSVECIKRWKPDAFLEAEHWAAKTHLRASDNPVVVPPKPVFLKRWS